VRTGAKQSRTRETKYTTLKVHGFCHNGSDLQLTLYILYTNRRTKINSQCALLMCGSIERNPKAATIEMKCTRTSHHPSARIRRRFSGGRSFSSDKTSARSVRLSRRSSRELWNFPTFQANPRLTPRLLACGLALAVIWRVFRNWW
jgi:hypothetical protein